MLVWPHAMRLKKRNANASVPGRIAMDAPIST
jgi:hypothetical protein